MSADEEKAQAPTLKKPKFIKVEGIKPEGRGLNLIVKVVKVDEAKDNFTEVVCADASACVTLKLRAEHAQLCEPDKVMRVQNAKVVMVGGFVRVMVDKWGIMKPAAEDTPGGCPEIEVNTSKDLSSTEYELA
mmetsp:Transcript_54987/g.154674  ORF Transcript_54987/g.154674 Transcript_54987/m.154674 type:complete len:132 (-) Transcript_54987:162-557(-)